MGVDMASLGNFKQFYIFVKFWLPCRHPCHTWDLRLEMLCEVVSHNFHALNSWDFRCLEIFSSALGFKDLRPNVNRPQACDLVVALKLVCHVKQSDFATCCVGHASDVLFSCDLVMQDNSRGLIMTIHLEVRLGTCIESWVEQKAGPNSTQVHEFFLHKIIKFWF